MGTIRIGISGWRYPPWRGRFYPKGLPQRAELAYAARVFDTVEINGTFYSLQRPEFFKAWHDAVPPGFVFAVKGGRFITHMKRLKEIEAPLANFFASGLLCLGPKLGPILWQFPPQFRFDPGRLDAFFALLPRDAEAASRLARRHDARVAGRAAIEGPGKIALRHAVEIRHESFRDPDFVALLRRHGIALVFADGAGLPYFEDVTAEFLYLRLHGSEERYTSGYTPTALDRWAARIARWAEGGEPDDPDCASRERPAHRASRDVYVYFDNDAKVHAPFDAQSLTGRIRRRNPAD